MNAILYLYRCRLKNWVRSLIKKPSKGVAVFFYVAFMLVFLLPGMFRSSGFEPEQGGSFFSAIPLLQLIILAVVLLISVSNWYSGTSKGSTLFSLPDGHFLFTAPYRPQTVLLYGLANQLQATLLSSFFLVYQFPNLRRAGLGIPQLLLLILLWIIAVGINQVMAMMIYIIASLRPALRQIMRVLIVLVPLLFLLWLGVILLVERDFIRSLNLFVESPAVRWFPMIGWFSTVALSLFTQVITIQTVIAAALLLLVTGLVLLVCYRVPLDFYEDALVQISQTAKMQERAKNVRSFRELRAGKAKVRGIGLRWGEGASAIVARQLRERFRVRPFLVGVGTLVMTLIPGFIAFMIRLDDEFPDHRLGMLIVLAVVLGVAFFSSMASSLLEELENPHFFILPASPNAKLIAGSVPGLLYHTFDLLPGLVLAGILLRAAPLTVLGVFLAAATFHLAMLTGQLITFKIMGSIKGTIQMLMLFLFTGMTTLPGVGLLIGSFIAVSLGNVFLANLLLFLIAAVQVGIFFLSLILGRSILRDGAEK